MPTPKTPERRRLDEILADGAWHDREQVIAVLVPLVAPGVAAREAERNRRHVNGHDGQRTKGHGQEREVGARLIAVKRIGTGVRSGTIEVRHQDGRVEIRRRR